MQKINDINPQEKLKNQQKKLIRDCIVEITTPMQRNFNVDLKAKQKLIEEALSVGRDNQMKIFNLSKQFGGL